MRAYRIEDLVDFPRFLPKGKPYIQWMEAELFDEQNMTYSLHTHDGNHFVFDARSGEIVSSSRPYRTGLRAVLGIAILIASIWVVLMAWKYQKHRRAMRALEKPLLNG